ncbi:MAG: alpha/beta hydrolase [Thermoanaerobacteraceae bacterium]|nr:alpha/beta hydrolase [Thermoanaerobacteraceae bacterium]
MQINKIPLDEKGEAYINTYVIEDSKQFQTGKIRPAVVICPGGGYSYIADRESEPVALRYLTHGFHAFVVHYSCGEKALYPKPLVDLAKSMAIVRKNSEEWHIDPDKIVVIGFSAGAHLASMLGTNWNKEWLKKITGFDPQEIKPNALILGYGIYDFNEKGDGQNKNKIREEDATLYQRIFGTSDPTEEQVEKLCPIKHISQSTPPTFIWHTFMDELVPVGNSLKFAQALNENNVPFELHIFQDGPHGLSLANETVERGKDFVNPHVAKWHLLSAEWIKKLFEEKN